MDFNGFNVDALEVQMAADKIDLSDLIKAANGNDEAACKKVLDDLHDEARRFMIKGLALHLAVLQTLAKEYEKYRATEE